MNNYYITLDDGFTYGPYNGKLEALLGGLNYYGINHKLTEQEKASLQDVEFYATSLWKGGNTIIVYSEEQFDHYLELEYIENRCQDMAALNQHIANFKQFIVQSPIY